MYTSAIVSLLLLAPFGTLAQRQRTSTDATCGGNKGYTCLNSAWGSCCSQYGWCGSKPEYCDKGCNPAFGTCNKPIAASSSIVTTPSRTPAVPAAPVSTDARCGTKFGGRTCQGSEWGNCCSQYDWCGSTKDHCDTKVCQKGFGQCNGEMASSMISSTLATSVKSSTSKSPTSSPSSTPSTSITRSTTSSLTASPTPGACYKYPSGQTCPTNSKDFNSACSSTTGSQGCKDGYEIRCSEFPSNGLTINTIYKRSIDQCLQLCTADTTCVGTAWDGSKQGECKLYSSLDGTKTSTSGQNVYRKLCKPAGGVSSPIATSSTPVPTSIMTSSTPSTSSAVSSSPSASSTPATCYQAPSNSQCAPYTGQLDSASFGQACTSPFSNYCVSNYRSFCFGKPSADSTQIRTLVVAVDIAECKSQCDQETSCVGFAFQNTASQVCTLYSSIKSIQAGDKTDTVFRKTCPTASSSSAVMSTPASSPQVFSTIVASSSPSPIVSSSSPTPTPSTCPYYQFPAGQRCDLSAGDSQLSSISLICNLSNGLQSCNTNYNFVCNSKPGADAVLIAQVNNYDADSCGRDCLANSTCVGMYFAPTQDRICRTYSNLGTLQSGSTVGWTARRLCK